MSPVSVFSVTEVVEQPGRKARQIHSPASRYPLKNMADAPLCGMKKLIWDSDPAVSNNSTPLNYLPLIHGEPGLSVKSWVI